MNRREKMRKLHIKFLLVGAETKDGFRPVLQVVESTGSIPVGVTIVGTIKEEEEFRHIGDPHPTFEALHAALVAANASAEEFVSVLQTADAVVYLDADGECQFDFA